ncbi:hypothetical protein DDN72_14070 [Vibrio cholerae]|uniref:hypothetical protein n=1 Tax=Vibrio cholerae TaxID=666 RepID=UPI001C9BF712|nr:hypothetical protein [Vibrio cholerae]EGR4314254.1 hypothetical protein [Vibrio cholerae]MBY8105399.1 hypothetical protein [Vibrio fluvialis]
MNKSGIALLSTLIISGCGQSNIDKVKESYPYFNDTLTIGGALDNRKLCASVEWIEFETPKGEQIVEYRCSLNGANQYLYELHALQAELMKERIFYSRYRDLERHYKWDLNAPVSIPKAIEKKESERKGYQEKLTQLQEKMKYLDPKSFEYRYKADDEQHLIRMIEELNDDIAALNEALNSFDKDAITADYQDKVAKADQDLANIIDKKFGNFNFVDAVERIQWAINKDGNAVLGFADIDFTNASGNVYQRPINPEDALVEAYEDRISTIEQSMYVKTYLARLGFEDR